MGVLKIKINESFSEVLRKKLERAGPRAAHEVATLVSVNTEPFVPMLTGALLKRTQVVENMIVYPGPYARFLYRGKVWVDPKTHAAGFLTEDGWKSRYGVKKIETDRELVFTKSFHDKAQSHWFEASKAQNLDKWVEAAGKAVEKYLDE